MSQVMSELAVTARRQAAVERVFRPYACRSVSFPNRVVMAPMTRNHSKQGIPGPDVLRYYESRAKGGTGLIITEGVNIDHPAAAAYPHVPRLDGAQAMTAWRDIVEAVHQAGARIMPQLWHVGPMRRPGFGARPELPGYGPSAVQEAGTEVVRAMTVQDIDEVVASFGRAAAAARDAGFDGVEIHGAHGYLIDSFFWRQSNTRQDAYGAASMASRTRFACEVIREVRRHLGPELPIVFRFSQWKTGHYDATIADSPEELAQLLAPLTDAGVDMYHVSTRRVLEPAFPALAPHSLAHWTRQLTGVPVIAVGGIGLNRLHQARTPANRGQALDAEPEFSDALLDWFANGEYDMVAVGRALLCDPAWANKLRAGRWESLNGLTELAYKTLVS